MHFRWTTVAVAAVVGFSTCANGAPIILPVAEDVLVNTTNDANYNAGQFFDIIASETGPSTGYWGSWIKFDTTPLIGQQVGQAFLDLTAFFNHSSTPISHAIYSSSNDSWVETTITGQNQPGEGTLSLLDTVTILDVSGVYSWDVTAAFRGTVAADGKLSLHLRPETYPDMTSRGPHFYSKESDAGQAAQLRVVLVPEPTTAALAATTFGLLARRSRRHRSITVK